MRHDFLTQYIYILSYIQFKVEDIDLIRDSFVTRAKGKILARSLRRFMTTPALATAPACATSNPEQPEIKRSRPSWPKRKVALMLGYCGTGYQGMQLYKIQLSAYS